MTSLESSQDKNCMESSLISTLHGNLHLLSERSFEQLKNYFAIGILTSKDHDLLLKRTNSRTGYVEGATLTRLKELNPSSRDHISWILQTFHGWKPKQLTATGKPIIDEVILKEIGTEVATMCLRILTIRKMLGMIQDGENAWMKLSTTANRIHHHCSVATNTHRCAHRRPNLGSNPE